MKTSKPHDPQKSDRVRRRFLRPFTGLVIGLMMSLTAEAAAPLKVVVTLPEIAEVVRDIGGSAVEVTSLLSGSEDPHFVDATPSLIATVSRADIVCSMGLELESGWIPKVLAKAANAKVQSGGPGFCELGRTITVLDKLVGVATDRSKGDIHAAGNPHFNLSPRALSESSREVLNVLKAARPDLSAELETRAREFEKKMKSIEDKTRAILKPAIEASKQGPVVIEYHKEFAYFFNLYELRSFGAIEEKPGVSPSAGRLARVSTDAKNAGVRLALSSLNAPIKHMARFSELSGIPSARVPTTVQTSPSAEFPGTNSIEGVQLAIANAVAHAFDKVKP